jgi:hypothetical protein
MRLYLVSRADLPPGRRAAMLCHAVHEYTAWHGQVPNNTTVVLLETPELGALVKLFKAARDENVLIAPFLEPDFDYELAALAMNGEDARARALCAKLPLAFKDVCQPKQSSRSSQGC